MRAAVVQLTSGDDLSDNLQRVARWVGRAAEQGARLVLLPENFAFFGVERQRGKYAEDLQRPGPILEALGELSRKYSVAIVGGGMPEASGDAERPYNTCVAFDERGALVGSYRKIHLFDVELPDGSALRESSGTTPGEQPVVVELAAMKVGLSVCYDLRFARLYERLASEGAQLLVVPAAFTELTGRSHWHVLTRARAIENQCWLMAAGQWGDHPGDRRTYGHSLIVDPWGAVVAECPTGEGVAVADIDIAQLNAVRARMPIESHRRAL